MKYLKAFPEHQDYTEALIERKSVSYCKEEKHVHFKNKKNGQLTFMADEANSTIKLNRVGTATTLANASLRYSTDNGETWIDYAYTKQGTKGYSGDTITLENVGDSVKFKGTNAKLGVSSSNYHQFVMTGKIKASDDITSLFNEVGGDIAMPSYSCLRLFSECTSLTTAPELPATTLADGCYTQMFFGCTALKTAPALPATTLASYCYYYMFAGCTSLTTAHELPSKTLANSCYCGMFQNCASLTTAPELPATTMAEHCYENMFNGCTSLVNAPALPAMTLASYCYYSMFYNCTSLTTAHELPSTALERSCYYGMFQNCTSLTTAPALPATTMAIECYSSMFAGCTSLTTAPELPATTLNEYCYRYMFGGCTSLKEAPELPATYLAYYSYSQMFSGCSNLSYIKAMFTTRPSGTCTGSWVKGVASNGTFVKNAAASWTTTGINGIPTGWTVETAPS